MSFYYLPPIKKTTRKWREGLFKLDDGLGKEVTHDYYEKIDPVSGESSVKPKYSDMIDEDKSLINLVAQFVKQNPKHI